MKSYGHINFNENQAQQVAIGTETNFPSSPTPGRLVFKDKRLYICIEIVSGIPTWIPLTNELNTYVHLQQTPSATWNVTHNLGAVSPLVQVYDNATNALFFPDAVTIVDQNNLTITLNTAISGRAIIMHGDITGAPLPQFNYTHTQTTLSDTWIVNHNLGYYPIIRVFVGAEEILPASIVHNSVNQATITFSQPLTGYARCI